MTRRSSLVAVSLLVAASIVVLQRARQRERRAGVVETKGHKWFAATYDVVTALAESKVLGQLRRHIAGKATGKVLEIGVGTGANLKYYGQAESIVAVEPDPFMLKRARRRAQQLGMTVEFHEVPAESLPFANASFDTVVATLVLCTVDDPTRALLEARRVLRPNGTFRFIEHVRATGGLVAHLQEALTPAWMRIGAGCHLNRRTAEAISAAGFKIVEIDQLALGITPLIIGLARPAAEVDSG